jgi:hypothetical protein
VLEIPKHKLFVLVLLEIARVGFCVRDRDRGRVRVPIFVRVCVRVHVRVFVSSGKIRQFLPCAPLRSAHLVLQGFAAPKNTSIEF